MLTLISPELDTETTRVTSQIRSTALTTNSRETDRDRALLVLLEDIRQAKVVQRISGLVETVSATALGVNDTLGDTLAVKVREQIDQVKVLEEQRAVLAHALGLVGVRHGHAIAGGVQGVLRGSVAVVDVVAVDVAVVASIGGVLGGW